MSDPTPIHLTKEDFDRLSDLADAYAAQGRPLAELEAELSRAVLMPGTPVPRDVVAMNSTVVFDDEESGVRQEITLVYPHEADIDKKRVSVATPVGSALLGVGVAQTIDWTLPDGRRRRYRVLAVSASGAPGT